MRFTDRSVVETSAIRSLDRIRVSERDYRTESFINFRSGEIARGGISVRAERIDGSNGGF